MNFRETLKVHLDSIRNRDMDTFISTIDLESIVLIMPNGALIRDREQFIEFHKDWFADLDWQLECEIMQVEENVEMAFTLIDVKYKDCDANGNPVFMTYYLNLIFRNSNGKWLLIYDQNTIYKSQK